MTETTQASQEITVKLVIHLENGRALDEIIKLPDDTSPGEQIEFHVWIAQAVC